MNDYKEIYGEDDAKFSGKPHGWIQCKGTGVCIDLHCECGQHGHVDAEFFYYYRCVTCGRTYAVGCNVTLIPLNESQVAEVEKHACGIKVDEKLKDEKEFEALMESEP